MYKHLLIICPECGRSVLRKNDRQILCGRVSCKIKRILKQHREREPKDTMARRAKLRRRAQEAGA